MAATPGSDAHLEELVERAQVGDESAKEALLNHACDRLLRMTRRTFRGYPYLRRWEATDDVFQNSLIRLQRALKDVRVESVRHFFNLAGVQIRRELNDLARHHFGPEGPGKHHHTDRKPADQSGGSLDQANEPEDLTDWTLFHERVESLPEEEREVVTLVYYQGLSQEEAAKVLGISYRTVKRRWFDARTRLHKELSADGAGG